MLLIYSDTGSSRLDYILHELLQRRIGLNYTCVYDLNAFIQYQGPKLNYSTTFCENSFHIVPETLLFQTDIQPQTISVSEHAHWYKTLSLGNAPANKPFDVLAASFYLLSRYEEYTGFEPDKHGRFNHTNSIAWKHDFLEQPLVDIWSNRLRSVLAEAYPELKFATSRFQHISTVDVDFVFRYKGYTPAKQLLKWGNAIRGQRYRDALEQLRVHAGFINDPYDTFEYIEETALGARAQLMYFFLMRNGTPFDKNLEHTAYEYKLCMAQRHAEATIGLHPSYYTTESPEWIREEKKRFEKLSGQLIYHSRQHYLRFRLPDTYTALEQAGLMADFSMMYANQCGFRASTCKPFQFFNLHTNTASALTVHSPCVMDTTLRYGMQLSETDALRKIQQLLDVVYSVSGEFISIWHNSNLSTAEGWESWRSVFQTMHNLAAEKQST
jgi:hypothetical protein